jgi:alpha-glucosidase (family GH31 glycosyl hydrolase)
MKILLWQIPIEKCLSKPHPQKDADESYMIEKGFCAKESDGNPYRIPGRWFNNGLLIDFTNKEARDWWLSKRRYLLEDLDIDGFKIDGGEHLWKKGVIFSNHKNIDVMRNLYPIKYQEAYYNLIKEDKTKERVLYSRSGYIGSQAFTCHWAGDEDSTFEAFRASIRAGLSAGLSGISFWGFDLAGFSGDIPTPELFLRSTAVATFCPIMQYHSENTGKLPGCKDRTPWNIEEISGDKRVINVFRKFANLRMNLIPYIYNEAIYSSKTGLPLMRPLILDFPNDKRCFKYIYQYLFGRSILVAPVVWENINVIDVYLPKGKWIDFWNGKKYIGPKILEYKVPIDIIPIFIRENKLISINMNGNFSLCKDMGNSVDMVSNLVFFFSPSNNRVKLLNEDDGLSLIYINYKKIDDKIVLQVKSKSGFCNLGIWCKKPSKVIVNDIVYKQGLDNSEAKLANEQWFYNKNMKMVFVKCLNKKD